jgi:two-component system sensor histidine kinase QseC
MRNLVDNAIRYTPAGGRVRVAVASDGGRCQFSVSDSGPGIPASERDAVLRRFHRLDYGNAPGSGLGLAIVARIAELHGAALTLADNDQAPGLLASVAW